MKEIPLTRGKVAFIDDDDFFLVSLHRWAAAECWTGRNWYAIRGIKRNGRCISIKMHRFIMQVSDPKIHVDHINHDGLDNRKENLRLVNPSMNLQNSRKFRNGSSRFKGVSFAPKVLHKPWRAYVNKNGKRKNLGYFTTEIEAAVAYNEAAKTLFGEFAFLNPIPMENDNGYSNGSAEIDSAVIASQA